MESVQKQITPIGKVNFRNDERIFGIYDKDRLGHIYAIGKTGVGKSTLLLNMAVSDIEHNNGFCIIDPHGDIAESILDYIPQDRIEDVIYFNPADIEYPIAFNPLKNVHPDFHHLVASGLISTFKKIWADNWGPRLEHILRFSLLTLLQFKEGTLLDIQPLLTDIEFRNKVLTRITDQSLLVFWYNEYDKFSNSFRAEAISPILNKIGIFSSSSLLRNIVGQKARSFHILKVMDEGKILIINLAKGKLGEDVSALLGSLMVTQIQLAALYRARQLEHTRRPFFLYIDECHSFITGSISDILSESRKYGLSLFLTHQFIDQLSDEIRSSIFGNVGTMIAFRVGSNDATILSKEFLPVFNEIDLINLPRYSMYLKLMINGATSQPFSADTLAPKTISTSFKNEIIRYSQLMFGNKKMQSIEKQLGKGEVKQDNLFSKT
ncbi:MAG: type IV secretion system DNA-binding domain-containing protein [Bacteroidota bacterium]|nr:type IV secretion system DNA-binding domain-containing protein [Bacteroidota bacterium]